MTASIKRMLAEREAVEAAKRPPPRLPDPALDDLLATIARAKPFIDADCDPGTWPPSTRLTVWFFVLATSPNIPDAEQSALRWAHKMLDRARRRWLRGLPANPFSKERPA